jgi:hypothetical protein
MRLEMRIGLATQTTHRRAVQRLEKLCRRLKRAACEPFVDEIERVYVVDELDLRAGVWSKLAARGSLGLDEGEFISLDEIRIVHRSRPRGRSELVRHGGQDSRCADRAKGNGDARQQTRHLRPVSRYGHAAHRVPGQLQALLPLRNKNNSS